MGLATVIGAQLVAVIFVTLGHVYAFTTPDFGFGIDDQGFVQNIDRRAARIQGLRRGDRLVGVAPISSPATDGRERAAASARGPADPVRGPGAGGEGEGARGKEGGTDVTDVIDIQSAFHWLVLQREVGMRPARFVFERGSGGSGARPVTVSATLTGRHPPVWPSAGWSLGSFAVVLVLCVVLWVSRRGEPGLAWYIVVLLNVYIVLYGFTHMKELLPSAPLFLGYLFFDLFTLPLLMHLFLRFPTPVGWVRRRPWLPLLLYVPQVALTLATAGGYLRLMQAPTLARQQQVLLLGKWFIPLVFLAYLLGGMAVMIVRYVTSPVERRKQIQWVIYGGVMAGFLTAFFSIFQWRTSHASWLLESSEYLLPVYALLALTIGFSFLEFRLVDVERIVHRSLVYGVVSGLVVVIYLALSGGLGFLLTKVFNTTSTTVSVAATVGAAALFFPLRRAVQANVDRLFFRHRTVYEEILAQASSEFVTMLDLDRLSKVLLEMLVTKLNRRHAILLLAGEDRRLRPVRAAGRSVSLDGELPAVDSFTLRKLRAHASGETVAVARLLADVQPPRLARELAEIFSTMEASLLVFLVTRDRILGLLALGPRADGSMVSRDEITMLEALGRQLAVVVQNASAFTEIDTLNRDLARQRREILALKDRLEAENVYLREEIQEAARHGEIVGESAAIRQVLAQVARVAPTAATVLIHGESGTGKELVARAIHSSSDRRDRPLVTINCAAIPEGLLESELFGHEKGAFTGAVARQPGRFELADGGTLFFDEVGDMPLALQAKLLRALQEREFTPVGATRPAQVDVRVISATHRDLEARVAQGSFREDLLYRLNVVPLPLPALRERVEDIPLLAEYFAAELARRHGKAITGISRRAMDRLQAYPWPGNVRELANVMERAVVLSDASVLDEEVTLPRVRDRGDVPAEGDGDGLAGQAFVPFHDAVRDFKREYLRQAIETAEGNRAEAARRLELQRTYLYRLEKQLGLKP